MNISVDYKWERKTPQGTVSIVWGLSVAFSSCCNNRNYNSHKVGAQNQTVEIRALQKHTWRDTFLFTLARERKLKKKRTLWEEHPSLDPGTWTALPGDEIHYNDTYVIQYGSCKQPV